MNISIQNKMAYVDSTETRTYNITDVATSAAGANTVREKVRTFSRYLAESVSSPVFVSPTGKAGQAITDTKIIVVEETPIEGV